MVAETIGRADPPPPFRTDARILDRLEKLEALREAVKEFIYAHETDLGWPARRYVAMRKVLEACR